MGDNWYPYQPCPPLPQNQYPYPAEYLPPAEYSGQWTPSLEGPQTSAGFTAPYTEVNGPLYGLPQHNIQNPSNNLQYGYDPSQQFNVPTLYNPPTVSYQRPSEKAQGRVDFEKELEEYKAAKRAKMESDSISSFLAATSLSRLTKNTSYRSRSRSRSSSRKRNLSGDRYRSRSHHNRSPSRRRSKSPLRNRSPMRSRSPLRSRSPIRSRSPLRNRSHLKSRSRQRSESRHSSRRFHRSSLNRRSPSVYRRISPSADRRLSPSVNKRLRTKSRERQKTSERYTSRDQRSVSKSDKDSKKSLTERDEILDKWKKNFCNTEVKINEKLEEYNKKTEDIVEAEKAIWTRPTPAEIYYTRDETNIKVCKGTQKLIDLATTFKETLVDRSLKVNAQKPVYVPPPRRNRRGLCKHKSEISSSDSDSSDATLTDEEDFAMEELQRKQQHPDRLDPEMWYNDPGEMNDGPLCRCSHKSRKSGIRHEIYPGENPIPKCDIYSNNGGKLYFYRIIISPPTNFLIKAPTIIHHDEHEFIFEGFSILSHSPLAKLPPCKVIRFNIEYTILYYEEKIPENFTVSELDMFVTFLFKEILELVDLDLTTPLDSEHCSQFHFMPRFVRELPDNGKEILCMQQVLQYLLDSSVPLIQKCDLEHMVKMSQYEWQNFADELKGMVVTYPGKKPSSVRVDQLDRNIDLQKKGNYMFPEIVHFGIRPPQLSYAGNPDYQKAWREYVKFRHLIANMSKPTFEDKRKLETKENKLQEMRTQGQMKRDVTVAVSAEGFYRTGIMCDIVQHAMLIPVLVCHLRFHNALNVLETSVNYRFENRGLLQLALTHPSYRENFGTNPDHARNSLTNCGIRQPEYGDRRIHYMNTRKRGINTLINIMSRFGKQEETESNITHNERLEFLGDAVVEFLSSIHLFFSFPHLEEGGLATYRAAIVQNQHLALLARVLKLDQFMLYAHGSDLCHDLELKHAMANCFEALMGALFLDGGIDVADRVFSNTLHKNEPDLLKVWVNLPPHPLQEQEPLGDRHWIEKFEILQKLTGFEKSINVEFNHIRLLARAFTDRSVGYTNLTMGSNQRLEFLGDTVLQLIASEYLYRFFPEHHEGHLSLLRSSLVNNRTQAVVCDDLGMAQYALYNNPKPELKTKDRADLLEALIGALYVDQGMEYCEVFCQVTLFPRLQDFIMNQDWNDPKSKLQQCCLTLRTMDGGEPDIPVYKVIECKGPTNTRVYTVAVYFRARRLASAMGHSIQQAEMNAAKNALENSHDLFPQLDHQKRVIAKSMKKQKKSKYSKQSSFQRDQKSPESYSRNRFKSKSPSKSYSKHGGNDSDDSRSSKDSKYTKSMSPPKSYRVSRSREKTNSKSKVTERSRSSGNKGRRSRSHTKESIKRKRSSSKDSVLSRRSRTPCSPESNKEKNDLRGRSKTPCSYESKKETSPDRLSRSKTSPSSVLGKEESSYTSTYIDPLPESKEKSLDMHSGRSPTRFELKKEKGKDWFSSKTPPSSDSIEEKSKDRDNRSTPTSFEVKKEKVQGWFRSKTPPSSGSIEEKSEDRDNRSTQTSFELKKEKVRDWLKSRTLPSCGSKEEKREDSKCSSKLTPNFESEDDTHNNLTHIEPKKENNINRLKSKTPESSWSKKERSEDRDRSKLAPSEVSKDENREDSHNRSKIPFRFESKEEYDENRDTSKITPSFELMEEKFKDRHIINIQTGFESKKERLSRSETPPSVELKEEKCEDTPSKNKKPQSFESTEKIPNRHSSPESKEENSTVSLTRSKTPLSSESKEEICQDGHSGSFMSKEKRKERLSRSKTPQNSEPKKEKCKDKDGRSKKPCSSEPKKKKSKDRHSKSNISQSSELKKEKDTYIRSETRHNLELAKGKNTDRQSKSQTSQCSELKKEKSKKSHTKRTPQEETCKDRQSRSITPQSSDPMEVSTTTKTPQSSPNVEKDHDRHSRSKTPQSLKSKKGEGNSRRSGSETPCSSGSKMKKNKDGHNRSKRNPSSESKKEKTKVGHRSKTPTAQKQSSKDLTEVQNKSGINKTSEEFMPLEIKVENSSDTAMEKKTVCDKSTVKKEANSSGKSKHKKSRSSRNKSAVSGVIERKEEFSHKKSSFEIFASLKDVHRSSKLTQEDGTSSTPNTPSVDEKFESTELLKEMHKD